MGAAHSKGLYDAAVLGRTDEVLQLLEHNVNPNWAGGADGHTALMKAAQAGRLRPAQHTLLLFFLISISTSVNNGFLSNLFSVSLSIL